jgi:cytosine/adenosine deaminase-related metal-dependent hydrolase
MVEGGLTSAEGLAAATAGSAAALGSDDVGAVEPGRSADLLVVDGDPSSDVRLLADRDRIWLVLRDGRPVAGTALEAESSVRAAALASERDGAGASSPCLALLAGVEAGAQ